MLQWTERKLLKVVFGKSTVRFDRVKRLGHNDNLGKREKNK